MRTSLSPGWRFVFRMAYSVWRSRRTCALVWNQSAIRDLTLHVTRYPLLLPLVALAIILTACEQTAVATPEPTTITIAGATAMQPVLLDLTTAFSQQHPNILFNLRGGGSTVGEERVQAGQVDLAASTLTPTEPISTAVPAPALVHVPIGLDGLAIIVHPTNIITNVSILQLRDLYTGRVFDWSALQSPVGEVLLVSREDGSGSRALFEERVMGEESVSLTAVIMPTSRDVVDFVARTPQAMGYVSRAYVHAWVTASTTTASEPSATATLAPQAASPVRVLQLEGIAPSSEEVRTQRYFLTQPLYLVSRGEPQGWARQFIEFVLSPAGQEIIGRYHVRVR